MSPLVFACSRGRIVLLDLAGSTIEHAHPHAQILVKISGPDRKVPIAGTTHVLCDNVAVVLEPWTPHGGVPDDQGLATRILAFHIEHEPPDENAAQQPFFSNAIRSGSCLLPQALRNLALAFYRNMTAGLATQSQADSLIDDLLRTQGVNPGAHRAAVFMDYRIRRVVSSIQLNPVLGTKLNDCARLAGLSRQHFFCLFRSSTGMSPRMFCNSVRLEAAVKGLLDETTPIRSISKHLGFSAPSHFTRFFLQHLGVSPRRFREGARPTASGLLPARAFHETGL